MLTKTTLMLCSLYAGSLAGLQQQRQSLSVHGINSTAVLRAATSQHAAAVPVVAAPTGLRSAAAAVASPTAGPGTGVRQTTLLTGKQVTGLAAYHSCQPRWAFT